MGELDKEKQNTEPKKKVHLSFRRFVKICFHVFRQFDDTYYTGFAAQIAYFFFMSSIPILIVLSQVLGVFEISMDFIKDWLNAHLSTQMGSFLSSLFDASSASVVTLLLVVLAIWAASGLEFSLARLTTYTLTGGKYRFRWLSERIKAIPMAFFSLLAIAIALLVYVYGDLIATTIFKSEFMANLIAWSRTPMLLLSFFVMILANYYIIPRIKVPISALLPGSIVATLGIMLVTKIYSYYISKAIRYNLLYGTFSNIVAMLLWFYCIAWVILIGMMVNKSWDIHMERGRLKKENLKKYVINHYGPSGEEMWNKLYIADDDYFDKNFETFAVRMSRKFDPGYSEKRDREIKEYQREKVIRKYVEMEVEKEVEEEKQFKAEVEAEKERLKNKKDTEKNG